MAAQFLQLYPASTDALAMDMSAAAWSYRNFYWQNFCWAQLQSRTGKSPVYDHHFTHVPPISESASYDENRNEKFGAFHTTELPYIFHTFNVRDWRCRR